LSADNVFKLFADYVCGLLANTLSRPDFPLISQFKTSCRVSGICAGKIFMLNEGSEKK
jgi:hypothetical protein